jgi:MFS family permease
MGGGGLMAISTFIASDLIPLRQRGIVQGITNICYGSGAMLGGIFGGLVQDHAQLGWRLAFLLLVPPSLVSAVAVAYLVRIPPKQSDKSYLARIDFVGALLVISFLVLLLLGLNSGGNMVPWLSPLPLITIPLSLVVLALMIRWESKAPQPILPARLFHSRTPVAACACNLVCTMAVMCGIFYAPMYLQTLGESATSAGMAILPSPVGVSVGSLAAGWWMRRTGKYYSIGLTFTATMVVGFSVFNLLGRDSPRWLIGFGFFLVGVGYGSHLTITLLACISSVDHSQQAVITSATCKYEYYPINPSSWWTISADSYDL